MAHLPGTTLSRTTTALTTVAALGALAATTATAHTAYNLTRLRRPGPRPATAAEPVSVLVPARDEAARIESCVRSILASTGVELELVVLDDGSRDGTVDVVRAAAGDDRRLRVVEGAPLRPGWTGKAWACHQLARLARHELLVFVDADVTLAPDGLAATAGLLRESGLDLVCPYPRQLADGALPRLVQPLLQWSWLTFLPAAPAERSARPSLAAANGQLLAVDAAAYRAAGGHEAVRGAVLDDIALLRALRRAGRRGTVVDGTDVAVCRMYDDGAALVAGYTKSLWSAFGSRTGAAAVGAGLAMSYVLPVVVAVTGPSRAARGWGALGYAAGVAGRALVARRTGGRVADSLAHPVSILVFDALLVMSWRRRRTGTIAWRGRTLPVP